MRIHFLIAGVVSILLGFGNSEAAVAADSPRAAEMILQEYQAIVVPTVDRTRTQDQAYLRENLEAGTKARAKRSVLALELFRADPRHARISEVMLARWQTMAQWGGPQLDAEIEEFLKIHPDSTVKADVLYWRADLAAMTDGIRPADRPNGRAIEDFIRAYPQDERGAYVLMTLARGKSKSTDDQLTLYRRIATDYAGTRTAKVAEGGIRRLQAVGQPFALTFTDAIKSETVSLESLRGQVVVIDFWATWCGPCIAEMPKLKELYAKYQDQGVEFIGVSLDLPGEGLEKLKKYVAENDIPWPQYYQGNGWDSEFSQSWGINAIPSLFVIDAQGRLHSTDSRGKLEAVIGELIKQRDERP